MDVQLVNNSEDEALMERIIASLREVYDPEIPINIYDLGLIYGITIHEDARVDVLMSLTTPNCPAAGIIPSQVESAVAFTDGVEDVDVELTFDPPFTVEMMSDEAKLELGFM